MLTHFRTKRHRANTTSRNASLAKHRCAYASYAAITLLHYLPSRSRTATSEFGHGLFIKAEHTFQQPTLPYTTRRCAITIITILNNSLSRWIEIKRAVRWDYDSAMTTWVKLLLCICMFYDNKKASCAKLFCCYKLCWRNSDFATTSSGNHMSDFSDSEFCIFIY